MCIRDRIDVANVTIVAAMAARMCQRAANPILRFADDRGIIRLRIASNTTVNCSSYFSSSPSSRFARSEFDAIMWRTRTNARMIALFTRTARELRRTLDSVATPCSVKTYGRRATASAVNLCGHNL